MYKVLIKRKILRSIDKLPVLIQKKLFNLIDDLKQKGPLRNEWPNFSGLGYGKYHCHLTHKWVACWKYENDSIEIEVYYAGSRENAPY